MIRSPSGGPVGRLATASLLVINSSLALAQPQPDTNGTQSANKPELSPFYSHVIEALPDKVARRQTAFERKIADAAVKNVLMQFVKPYASVVIRDYRRWAPGSTLTVAFPKTSMLSDSERSIREDIERLVQSWIGPDGADLKLSFRREDGTFREWSPLDKKYAANIRITFSGDGYWSVIGRLSEEPKVIYAGEASMSLSGFASARPGNWKRILLHEFGHALGFAHEHQNTSIDCGFRFADDPGYVPVRHANGGYIPDVNDRRPGLYTWFSGPPNKWDKAKVDQNIGPLGLTEGYKPTDFLHDDFDPQSIMVYYFEPEFFVRGRSSECYVAESQALSAADKLAANRAYQMIAISDIRLGALKSISESADLSADLRSRTARELKLLRRALASQ